MAKIIGCHFDNGFLVGKKDFDCRRISPFGYRLCTSASVDPGNDITEFRRQGVKTAGKISRENTNGDNSGPQQDTLGRIHIGHRAQSAQADIQ